MIKPAALFRFWSWLALALVLTQANTKSGVWSTVHWICLKVTVLFCFSGDHRNARSQGCNTLLSTLSKYLGFYRNRSTSAWCTITTKTSLVERKIHALGWRREIPGRPSEKLCPNWMEHTYESFECYQCRPLFLHEWPKNNRVAPPPGSACPYGDPIWQQVRDLRFPMGFTSNKNVISLLSLPFFKLKMYANICTKPQWNDRSVHLYNTMQYNTIWRCSSSKMMRKTSSVQGFALELSRFY